MGMWERIRRRIAMVTPSAKTLAALWAGLTILYVENDTFHDYVFDLFSRFPHFMQEFVVGFVVPILIMVVRWRKSKEDTP